eukprot:m.81998 g.81998  ORF g.81998 m.81998 type:complete len:75 (-) comp14276_c0_seq4:1089-1313(-)
MEAVERTAKKAKGSAPGSHTEQKEDLVLVDDKPMEQQLGDPGAKVVGNFPLSVEGFHKQIDISAVSFLFDLLIH